jgi:hypothetical protein
MVWEQLKKEEVFQQNQEWLVGVLMVLQQNNLVVVQSYFLECYYWIRREEFQLD